MRDGDGDRLMGWKAIGNFVDRDARTARRLPPRWIASAIALAALIAVLIAWNVRDGWADAVTQRSAPYAGDKVANAAYQAASYAMNTRSSSG